MEFREKALYVQIHPAKMLSDWSSAVIGLVLLWYHAFYEGVVVIILPSVVASAVILRYVSLEPYRDSAFGRYFGKHMGRPVAWARIFGLVPMGVGAWFHTAWPVIVGVAIVSAVWGSGLLSRPRSRDIPA